MRGGNNYRGRGRGGGHFGGGGGNGQDQGQGAVGGIGGGRGRGRGGGGQFPPKSLDADGNPICHFFLKGNCNKGDQCNFSHNQPVGQPNQSHHNNQHHQTGGGGGPPSSNPNNLDFSQKEPCHAWIDKHYCPRARCKYAHRLTGTENPADNTYVVINSMSIERLIPSKSQQHGQQAPPEKEIVLSSTEATIQGSKALIIVTNQNRCKIFNLDTMSDISDMPLAYTPTLVRSFHEMPDNIFIAYTKGQAQFINIMLPKAGIQDEDPHGGEITDILSFLMNGQRVVLTGCQDSVMRAYTISSDQTKLEKQLAHPTPGYFVTAFQKSSDTFIICALNNGQFLGWDLSTNAFNETLGHTMGTSLKSIYKHESYIITGDMSGKIQIRDLNTQFTQVVPEVNLVNPNLPAVEVTNLLVHDLPPKNEPYIFAGTQNGNIVVVKVGADISMFGAHNDAKWRHQGGQSNMQPGPDLEIIRLIKISAQVFMSLSKDGLLRQWQMGLQPIMQKSQPQPQQTQQFGGQQQQHQQQQQFGGAPNQSQNPNFGKQLNPNYVGKQY